MTVALVEETYRLDAYRELGQARIAYAVVDQWGWAIVARTGGRLRTVARVDFQNRPGEYARAHARRRLEGIAVAWPPVSPRRACDGEADG